MAGGREMHFLPQKVWQHFWNRGHWRSVKHLFGGLSTKQVNLTGGQDQVLPVRGRRCLLQAASS